MGSAAPRLFPDAGLWHRVDRDDPRARRLVDGEVVGRDLKPHYSRQTPGAPEFMASGKVLVLLTDDALAVWGVIECRAPGSPELRWRCSMFRNEGPHRSSDLVREATARTYAYWRRRYGGLPAAPLRTEVDASRTRRKRDPGRCFRRAGWREVERLRGHAAGAGELVVLEAPNG